MKLKTIFLFAACFYASLAIQAQTKLNFNPEKGEKYTYRFLDEKTLKNFNRNTTSFSVTDYIVEMIDRKSVV